MCEDALTYARDGHCGELGKTTDPAEIPGWSAIKASMLPIRVHECDPAAWRLASTRFSCALTERLMVLGFVRIDQLKQITCASAIRLVPEVTVASPQIP